MRGEVLRLIRFTFLVAALSLAWDLFHPLPTVMNVRQIYDPFLAQYTYLVGSAQTGEALLIDPQRDVDRYFDAAAKAGLQLTAAFETHLHADFVSGLRECAERGLTVYASAEGAPAVAYDWLAASSYSHALLSDGDTVTVGSVTVEALHTPGHSPEHLTYLIRDDADSDDRLAAATGDFLFVEGVGQPRLAAPSESDEPPDEGEAESAFARSLRSFRSLPDSTEVWPLHGAGTRCGYAPSSWPTSTVAHEKEANPVVRAAEGDDWNVANALRQHYPMTPPYFSRMKSLNQSGPPRLESLPHLRRTTLPELLNLCKGRGVVFLDTRPDRSAFLDCHLPGALHAPLNPSFLSVVGSYVSPSDPVYLILEDDDLERAVRALARIGIDDVAGYCPPSLVPHVDAALNIPFLKLGIPCNRPPALNVSPDTTLLVYSETGRRAAVASAYLERQGYHVAAVNDHFRNWRQKRVEVRTESS